ncbi:uncharacterized protein MONBRDRAFT_9689 [Monosiga brevicollis MX1]|uniref:Cation efflux protein transmembrane domain-containing protein n=1 Tax=Monosiga brevicollis TaxID=81824 RepID=A9V3H2_MONBE|nr:uncharacterized protein MONBRDRAFT_9689 [Monosiga brevicollis MX1]EDQ87813.1 predicted protein [Monosiga brevicollis MX1]|eukprot:XP_001747346.1 hypothetical protein [Monosiga brevicollis MX1]
MWRRVTQQPQQLMLLRGEPSLAWRGRMREALLNHVRTKSDKRSGMNETLAKPAASSSAKSATASTPAAATTIIFTDVATDSAHKPHNSDLVPQPTTDAISRLGRIAMRVRSDHRGSRRTPVAASLSHALAQCRVLPHASKVSHRWLVLSPHALAHLVAQTLHHRSTGAPAKPPVEAEKPATAVASETLPRQQRDPDKIDLVDLETQIPEDWSRIRDANRALRMAIPTKLNQQQPASTQTTLMLSLLGNLTIAGAKFYAYSRTGHSAMFSEAVHTLVDVGNQAILGWGLREAERSPDRSYQYGYGRAAFFYSLLTALSTFGFGAMYTFYQGTTVLLAPPEELQTLPETWAILGAGLLVDGFVLKTALKNTRERAQAANMTVKQWILSFKDPFTVAVVFEDSAAVGGVLIAALGIGLTQATGNPVYDGIATLCISGLLGTVAIKLIQLNHSFILGRAEVDFDGTWLAAQLFQQYEDAFMSSFAEGEDGFRKAEIRQAHPEAAYVEIVPDSSQNTLSALKAMLQRKLTRQAEELQSQLTHHSVSAPWTFGANSVYVSMGQFEKAIPQFQTCLRHREIMSGADSIPVAAVLDRLARCYLVLGDTGKAANVINRSRNILASIKWADATLAEKNLLAYTYDKLAKVLALSNQRFEAMQALEEAAAIKAQQAGSRLVDLELSDTLYNLGNLQLKDA